MKSVREGGPGVEVWLQTPNTQSPQCCVLWRMFLFVTDLLLALLDFNTLVGEN